MGSDLHSDLRIAVRSLRRRPGFTLLAVLTLGVGIGAVGAVFGMANQLLLRTLPGIRGAEDAAYLEFRHEAETYRSASLSPVMFEELRAGTTQLEGIAAHALTSLLMTDADGGGKAVTGRVIQGDYFELLGVRPAIGRLFTADELRPDAPGDPLVAVISHALWTTAFGGDRAIVGRTVRANRQQLTVIGVAQPEFRGAQTWVEVDIWVPLRARVALGEMTPESLTARDRGWYSQFLVRPREGISFEAAQAELAGVYERIARVGGGPNADPGSYQPRVYPRLGLEPDWRESTRSALQVLMGVVVLVLLIACANVANLLLFRGLGRRGETAVRRALGGSRLRIALQVMVESLILALASAAVAVVIAFAFTEVLAGLNLAFTSRIERLVVDWRVVAFLVAAALVVTPLIGMLPAMVAGRVDLATAMRRSGMRSTARTARVRAGASVVQIALSLALLIGALLLARTVRNLYAVDAGFDYENLWLARTYAQFVPESQEVIYQTRLLEELRALPIVESAALEAFGPFGPSLGGSVRAAGASAEDAHSIRLTPVTPGYFDTMRLPLLHGRAFTEAERNDPSAGVILSAAVARRLFGVVDATNRAVTLRTGLGETDVAVIGITRDARMRSVLSEPDALVFSNYAIMRGGAPVTAVVRTRSQDAAAVEQAVREAARRALPDMPPPDVTAVREVLDSRLGEQRLFARLIGLLATMAAGLAAIGLYGVMASAVAERTREFGIRMALGAQVTRIVGQVVRQGAWITLGGIALGLGAGAALTRVLAGRLFGVTPLDPGIWIAAVVLLVLVATGACLVPGRAATRVQPAVALRAE